MNQQPASTPSHPAPSDRRAAYAPYAAFAAFGIFWGAWGAALPALRTQAGVSEGQLGTALLFVGLGALPSMALTGRAVDRFGLSVAAWLLAALAGAGLLITSGAHGMVLLVLGMLVVGAASGAADVSINTLAGRAEHVSAKPLLTRSHGLFSVGVVVSSLATGALLGAESPLPGAFAVVAVVMLLLAVVARRAGRSLQVPAPHEDMADDERTTSGPRTAARAGTRGWTGLLRRIGPTSPLLIVGLVAALAYAIENAHQSWGAVMLTDVFAASPELAAAAPATFAATAALARLSLAPLSRSHPTAILLGPAYVGLLAEATDLRGALLGVAALAVVFTVAAAPISAWAARRRRSTA
ncbi:MFS transporter [Kocuria marina]|uniref:MFS transporter n=1 Tax=Kocuria marina TaxID=223184 RepID=UPI0022E457F2|nr:MFS transporter [Kocuria marina]